MKNTSQDSYDEMKNTSQDSYYEIKNTSQDSYDEMAFETPGQVSVSGNFNTLDEFHGANHAIVIMLVKLKRP